MITPAAAGAQWSVGASAGSSSYDLVSANVSTASGVLELRRDGTRWLNAALGVPLDSGGTGWAVAAAGGEVLAGDAHPVGLRASVQAFGYGTDADRFAGWGFFADAAPVVRSHAGPLEVEARAGALLYRSADSGATLGRSFGYAALAAAVRPDPYTEVSADLRFLRDSNHGHPHLSATAARNWTSVGAWARAGYWFHPSVDGPELAAGGYLAAGRNVALIASVRRDTDDPVFRVEPRTSWSVGVTFGLGGGTTTAGAVAVPLDVRPAASVIRVPVSEVTGLPLIAGDFNNWHPQPMTRQGNEWVLPIQLEPGTYRYAFTNVDGEWYLPASVEQRVDDGFGGENGVLIVQ